MSILSHRRLASLSRRSIMMGGRELPLFSQDPDTNGRQVQTQHLYDLTCLGIFNGQLANSSSGDVGGQKTLRSYWRNYFEKTDALIWVVDATDRLRIKDCRDELHGLLQEEVCSPQPRSPHNTRAANMSNRGFQARVYWSSRTRRMSRGA